MVQLLETLAARGVAAAPAYLVFDRAAPQLVEPALAYEVAFTLPASWVWGTRVQITPGLAYDILLMGVYACTAFFIGAGAVVAAATHIEINTGAAGAEVPRAVVGDEFYGNNPSTTTITIQHLREYPVQPFVIPAGTRIAVRGTNGSPIIAYGGLYLFGFDNATFPDSPDAIPHDDYWGGEFAWPGGQGTHVTPMQNQLILTGSAGWFWGPWDEVIASAPATLLLKGVISGAAATSRAQVQLGVGAVGSEVGYDILGFPRPVFFGPGQGYARLARPMLVNYRERVVMRAANRTNLPVNLAYEELLIPL